MRRGRIEGQCLVERFHRLPDPAHLGLQQGLVGERAFEARLGQSRGLVIMPQGFVDPPGILQRGRQKYVGFRRGGQAGGGGEGGEGLERVTEASQQSAQISQAFGEIGLHRDGRPIGRHCLS